MAKRLTMAEIDTILTLHKAGHSNREISALVGVNRETVGKYVARAKAQNQPNAPTGNPSDDSGGCSAGNDAGDNHAGVVSQSQTEKPSVGDPPTGPASLPPHGPPSECEAFREEILAKIEQGLEAVRIHQDLVIDHRDGAPSYYSVRRFIARLRHRTPLPFRRMETCPAEEAQVDFGSGALVRTSDGKVRRPWIFRIVLSYSRKAYSEAVWRQTSEAFIACLENAFRHFGGVPKRLVIDNLKAVVARGDWYDPEVHPKLQSFARHYGTVFLPTKPYTPRHKGKIESGVKYVKRNALKARVFTSLAEENEFLLNWETQIADQRIHGTTKQQVEKLFEQAEQRELLPLPIERFPFFHEARHSVHRDGHLEVDKAFYSAPPEYVGHRLWVRWDSRLVRIYNDRWEQVAVHAKAEPGRFRTAGEHIPKEKVSAVERGTDALLRQIASIGPHTRQWAEAMTQARGVEGVRVLVGLKNLAGKHDSEALEEACRVALSHGAYRLRTVRKLLQRKGQAQQQFEFLEEHPIIRPLSDYSLASLLQFRKDRNHDERQIG
jgi:transposase